MSKKIIQVIIWGAILLCYGCGGGTVGTGDISGPDTRFYGTLETPDGQALSGVEVTLANTGDSVVSDQNGYFDIKTQLPDQNPLLLIRSDTVDQMIALTSLESLDSEVKLSIIVDSTNNSVTLESIEVSIRGEDTSTATSSSSSSASSSSSTDNNTGNQPQSQLSIFKGIVLFEDGAVVDGAQLVLKPQNVKTSTNSKGKFQLEALIHEKSNILQVKYKSSKGQVSLGKLPSGQALIISMKLIVKRPPEDGGQSVGISSTEPKVVLSEIIVKKTKKRN